ncbi:MAG: hypothetical protein DMD41_17230 [Gemmatimonadetes bacterium]|nr:MAG: hypothetical protein DMD41_17230 [Gemmatimonadota bacterium]
MPPPPSRWRPGRCWRPGTTPSLRRPGPHPPGAVAPTSTPWGAPRRLSGKRGRGTAAGGRDRRDPREPR